MNPLALNGAFPVVRILVDVDNNWEKLILQIIHFAFNALSWILVRPVLHFVNSLVEDVRPEAKPIGPLYLKVSCDVNGQLRIPAYEPELESRLVVLLVEVVLHDEPEDVFEWDRSVVRRDRVRMAVNIVYDTHAYGHSSS